MEIQPPEVKIEIPTIQIVKVIEDDHFDSMLITDYIIGKILKRVLRTDFSKLVDSKISLFSAVSCISEVNDVAGMEHIPIDNGENGPNAKEDWIFSEEPVLL